MKAKELINYLTEQGFNVYPDANFIPDMDNDSQFPALFVFGTGGFESHDYLPIANPTFQIIVKGKSYKENFQQMDLTEQLAKNLIDLLNDKTNYAIGSTYIYHSKAMQSNPIPLGLDKRDRPTFSTNFRFRVKEV